MITNFNKYIKEELSKGEIQRVLNPEIIEQSLGNTLKKYVRMGYKPYYINSDYVLTELKLNKNHMPYTESEPKEEVDWRGRSKTITKKTSYSNRKNIFGNILILNEEEFEEVNKVAEQVRAIKKKYSDSIKLLDELIASTTYHIDKK